MSRPSPTTLRAFATAGRLLSFRDAAAELHVTASAISHQVKSLEEWVGAALFTRTTRRVELTALGAQLSESLNDGFAQLDHALDQARTGASDNCLRVSALPLFTNTWLAPRMSAFEQRWPGLSVHVDTVNEVVDLTNSDIDVGIRNTPVSSSALVRRKLIDLYAVPLCTQKLAISINGPADLLQCTLIQHSARPDGWATWFAAQGLPKAKPKKTLSIDNLPSAISAAVQGAGVMMGLAPFVWDAPGVERLVNPIEGPLMAAGDYSVVYRKSDGYRHTVRAFVDWLFEEMKADARRLRKLGGV